MPRATNNKAYSNERATTRRWAPRAVGLMTRWPPRAPGIVPPALASMQQVDTSIAGVEHLKPIATVNYLTGRYE